MDCRRGRPGDGHRHVRAHAASRRRCGEAAHRDDLVDDAGEFSGGLAAFHLRLPGDAVELVGHALEDADENHRPGRRALQVLEQPDDLAPSRP